MRADAQRNYDRIVAAASDVFAERGADASLDEIAKRARVGAGTLYRHFPTRENLLDAAMKNWVDRIQTAADKAAASEQPPRELLLAWFEDLVAHFSLHRGGALKLSAAMGKPDSPINRKCQVLAQANAKVVERLVAEGALQHGLDTIQVCRLVGSVAAVADQGELDGSAVRPLLEIIADGLLLRTSSAPGQTGGLPVDARDL